MPTIVATVAHHVPSWITAVFALILVGLIVCLALEEKLHAKKSVIAGLFAILSLLMGAVFGILPFERIVVGSQPMTEIEQVDGHYVEEMDPAATPHEIHLEAEETEPQSSLHVGGHRLEMPVYIPGINWSVIAIILGSSLFVDVTSKSGLFT